MNRATRQLPLIISVVALAVACWAARPAPLADADTLARVAALETWRRDTARTLQQMRLFDLSADKRLQRVEREVLMRAGEATP